jgi:hypothetical protein
MSSSIEKNYCKKKKLLNSGNYLLSPLNENKNTRNNNSQNKNGIKIIINKLNTNQNIKNNNLNSQVLNNISRSIKETKLKSKNILSKINKGDISSDVNNILSICINKNNSNISSAKSNKYENNSKTEELNISNSNNNNNNEYYIKNFYINRNIKSSNSDSIKNNIINNKQSYEYLKTDINEIENTPNIKLVVSNDIVKKHDDIIGTPSGLFKKNNLSNFQFNTAGNILKNFYEKKTKKIFKLKNKDLERNISEVDYFNNNNKKGKCKCPEIMHFYYVYKFQEGKTNEIELEGE